MKHASKYEVPRIGHHLRGCTLIVFRFRWLITNAKGLHMGHTALADRNPSSASKATDQPLNLTHRQVKRLESVFSGQQAWMFSLCTNLTSSSINRMAEIKSMCMTTHKKMKLRLADLSPVDCAGH